MIDQSQINLIDLIPTPLKKVGQTGGGEYHGPCPFCGGTDRFVVQPQKTSQGGRWFCRQCGRHGDALAFVCDYEDLTVSEGMKRLNLIAEKPLTRVKPKEQPVVYAADLDREKHLCFSVEWQAEAQLFVLDCHKRLMDAWSWQDSRTARYLEKRGITLALAQGSGLGVNLNHHRATWGEASVWLPRGIVIPWNIEGELWNLRVRRPDADLKSKEDKKYTGPQGSCGYAMYGINGVQPGDTVVMTEGEFDAQLLQRILVEQGREHVSVVSIGSNTGARLKRWTYRLIQAQHIYLAFDNDSAGDAAAVWWGAALGRKATRLRPTQKDITDMYQCGELGMFMKGIS